MRKILIFSLVYYPKYVGGAEVAVKEITDRLGADIGGRLGEGVSDSFDFDMITLNGGNEIAFERVGNINVHRIFNRVSTLTKLLYPFRAYSLAKKLHRKDSYDIVWSIMASYAGYAGYKFKNKYGKHGVRHILTIQEGDHFGRRAGILRSIFSKIFASADKIQAISRFLADWSSGMGAKCPIEVVPNAVNTRLFSRSFSDSEISEIHSRINKKEGDIYLITTSRLVEKNAVNDIIEALTFLPANIKLLILGIGPDEFALKQQVLKLNLVDRVSFLGFVKHQDMPLYLKASDIFVRPSLTEGLGNSFLEAMAVGIPVIATRVGGIPDFLTDGETGLFCEVKNPRSIAQKVEKLIKDKESREYIVGKAKNLIAQKYDWENVAKKMGEMLS